MFKPQLLFLFVILFNVQSIFSQHKNDNFQFELTFEKSKGLETATYDEMMKFYKAIANYSKNISIEKIGTTDVGLPLHLVTYSEAKPNDKTFHILINNGIHPGESDGIDASMLMLKDIVNGKLDIPDNITLHIIPSYNLGGMLNRNSTTRANQNGPASYGFRGNAKNYDLNRDFIKMDTKNMEAFAEIYHKINPDVYVETHVSNGADYQYTLTHLITQHNKLGFELGQFTNRTLRPLLEKSLIDKGHIITPYVNVFGRTPDEGFSQFFDYSRYSTGYTSLWNTLGLMIETHMLKPYKKRVISTKAMLESVIEITSKEQKTIENLRASNFEKFQKSRFYKFNYVIDSTSYETLNFKGYEANKNESKVTGKPRLKYDNTKPTVKPVKYYNEFKAKDSLLIPNYYIVKSAWNTVIDKLNKNKIEMLQLKNDSIIEVESIHIIDFKTSNSAYEGHYPHYDTEVNSKIEQIEFNKGDYLISTDQKGIKYLIETLEPELKDSFFNWNFFDTVLQQKEHFSAYVFEDYALQFLKDNPEINKAFLDKKSKDESFRNNAYAQLNWIYKKSPLYEKAHLRLPIFRVLD